MDHLGLINNNANGSSGRFEDFSDSVAARSGVLRASGS